MLRAMQRCVYLQYRSKEYFSIVKNLYIKLELFFNYIIYKFEFQYCEIIYFMCRYIVPAPMSYYYVPECNVLES